MTDGQLSTSAVFGTTGVCNTYTADEQNVMRPPCVGAVLHAFRLLANMYRSPSKK